MSTGETTRADVVKLTAPVVAEITRTVADAIRRHVAPLGDDELLTPIEVGKLLKLPTRAVGEIMTTGELPSSLIPGVGRRCTVAALRKFIHDAMREEGSSE